MNAESALLAELRGLRHRFPEVSGVVLATIDGLLIASDASGIDPDPIAALAAASFGLGQQFAHSAGQGPMRESVVQSAGGLILTYPAGAHALLTVLARHGTDPVLLGQSGREVAHRAGSLHDGITGRGTLDRSTPPAEGCAPRPTRIPASTAPSGLPMRRAARRPPGRA